MSPSSGQWFLVLWQMPSPETPPHLPWTSSGTLPMPLGPSWNLDIMGVGYNTWWTRRGTVLSSALGSQGQTSWTPTSSGITISAVRTGPLHAGVVLRLEPHVGGGGTTTTESGTVTQYGQRAVLSRRSTNHYTHLVIIISFLLPPLFSPQ